MSFLHITLRFLMTLLHTQEQIFREYLLCGRHEVCKTSYMFLNAQSVFQLSSNPPALLNQRK